MNVQSLAHKQPRPYTPIVALRERAREAYAAHLESQKAERADLLTRAARRLSMSLVLTCQRMLYVDIDPLAIDLDIANPDAGWETVLSASVVVDSLRLELRRTLPDVSYMSESGNAQGVMDVTVICPTCSVSMVDTHQVKTLADIGRLIGRSECTCCGWTAPDNEATS